MLTSELIKKIRKIEITTSRAVNDVLAGQYHSVFKGRGMAFDENIKQIRDRGLHYPVAGLQSERNEWLDELEKDDWEQVIRRPSP